jgi:transposase
MGRSRGGLTTKIHAVVDANGNPITLKLSVGQAHDGSSAADMLGSVGAGQTLLADRAYDSDALRQTLAERGTWANVKPMPRRVKVPAFLGSPAAQRRHVGLDPRLIDKHQARSIYPALIRLPACPFTSDIGAVLLGRQKRFF